MKTNEHMNHTCTVCVASIQFISVVKHTQTDTWSNSFLELNLFIALQNSILFYLSVLFLSDFWTFGIQLSTSFYDIILIQGFPSGLAQEPRAQGWVHHRWATISSQGTSSCPHKFISKLWAIWINQSTYTVCFFFFFTVERTPENPE